VPHRPFGYGISLTTFSVTNATRTPVYVVSTHPPTPAPTDTSSQQPPLLSYSVKVTNTGNMTGDEVVFAYMVPKRTAATSGTLPLIKQLVDYQRVHLAPGQSQTVTYVDYTLVEAMACACSGNIASSFPPVLPHLTLSRSSR